ncbi:DUF3560 domain-containing protein [Edaphocola aurantiacus]|uniref:DUF3560 domain-containing protein n=1 Tax=Edaphocola aurantiacus TaxID=2601682 RepID=UPI001C94101D|nr:DUF3560 domain-containing protein [Edaphocola aurantiacus]
MKIGLFETIVNGEDMENSNYYIKNQETDKINIYTSKAFYEALPIDQKKIFTRFCLFSRKQDCWISKAKSGNAGYLIQLLSELGFYSRGAEGTRLPFAEQIARQQERAANRAERSEKRAEQATKRSNELYERASEMGKAIPMGQPILIGHHSEHRDRRYRERIHNTMGRSVEEEKKAQYYKDKAETAAITAAGDKYKNPRYLEKRIKEERADIRQLNRYLEGKFSRGAEPRQISEREKTHYTSKLEEHTEKLNYYINCMVAIDPGYQVDKPPKKQIKKGKGL